MKMIPGFIMVMLWSAVAWAAEPLLSEPTLRLTDSVIQSDLEVYHKWEKRMEALEPGMVPHGAYHLAKVRALLKMSWDEYHENETSDVIEASLQEAKDLILKFEAKQQNISLDTAMLPDTGKVRLDLWKIAEDMKHSEKFRCVEKPIAELEVELMWAGHQVNELGMIHARNELDDAEALAKRAQQDFDNCKIAKPEKPACIPASRLCEQPVKPVFPASVVNPVVKKRPNHKTIVYFDLNKGDLNAKGPGTLDAALKFIQQYPDAYRIRIEAHTDRLASKHHNIVLSKARAEHVRDYFVKHGIDKSLFELAWFGESKPVVFCSDKDYPTHDALAKCLQPNRRAEVLIYMPKVK